MTTTPVVVTEENLTQMYGMHVVLVGNPLDGFTIFGPFTTGEDAHRWADDEVDDDWFAAALHAPNENEEDVDD